MDNKKTKKLSQYSADDLKALTGLEPIRQSPAQYIGSIAAVSAINGKNNPQDGETLTAGGFHLFVETLANSSDEATSYNEKGKPLADLIEIVLHEDQSITITDNGRGVPSDINKETGKSGLELTFFTMNAGGKFRSKTGKGQTNYSGSSAGTHGIGSKAVCALSDRIDVTVWRDGKEYSFSAKEGIPGTFSGDGIRSKFTPSKAQDGQIISIKKDTRTKEQKKKFPTGTSVHWHPDPKIWGGTDIPWKDIYDAVSAQSYMAPTCTYRIIDETELGGGSKKKPIVTDFHHPKGIIEMVEGKTKDTTNISPVINFDVPAKYTKKIITDDNDGNMIQTEREYDIIIKASMRWTSESESEIDGYANSVHCVGQHVDGFRRGLSRGLVGWIKKSGIMTKKDESAKLTPNIDDVTDGMVAVIEVLLEDQCEFDSQTKEVLTNAEVLSCVSDITKEQIEQWLSTKKNAAASKRIGKSIIEQARLRTKQKNERERTKKIREQLNSINSKPAKLCDCRNEGPGTELIICEGDSAAGTIKIARDPAWQALIPIRGVSLNAFGAKSDKILANREFSDLVSAMRAGGIGKYFDMENRRYDRIAVYTDSDPDGHYIRALLLVFIYTQFPGMIENGKVLAGLPPLYSIRFISGDRKGEVEYMADEEARDEFIEKFTKSGGSLSSLEIARSKGLGEMQSDEFEVCLNPKTRAVRVITVDDVKEAAEAAMGSMKLLFSTAKEDTANRRVWIDETFEDADD